MKVVRAATIDKLLRQLAWTYQHSPRLRPRIEATVLAWNYCDVFFGGDGWDLWAQEGSLKRTRALKPAEGWTGFQAWGFIPTPDRIVPTLLEQNGLGRGQREWFLSETVHQRCFPHPVTGVTPFTDQDGLSKALGASALEVTRSLPLPSSTDQESCPALPAPPVPARVEEVRAVERPRAPEQSSAGPQVVASQGATGDTLTTAPPTSGNHHVSGVLYETLALAGRASVGARFAVSPFANTYLRTALVQAVGRNAEKPTYSWGIGYNDWHTNTFSLELNNWGPIPIDELDVKGTTLDLGYKVALPSPLSNYGGMTLSISYPLRAYPNAGFGVSAKLWHDWFVSSGIRWVPFSLTQSPDYSHFTWSYGFGNWSWKPYTFSLAYNNWGPNEVFDFNFQRNGSLTLGWSWAL